MGSSIITTSVSLLGPKMEDVQCRQLSKHIDDQLHGILKTCKEVEKAKEIVKLAHSGRARSTCTMIVAGLPEQFVK